MTDSKLLPSLATVLTNATPVVAPAASPRGIKRSRSPEQAYGDAPTGDVGDDNNGMFDLIFLRDAQPLGSFPSP
jgi:hypothetical protein